MKGIKITLSVRRLERMENLAADIVWQMNWLRTQMLSWGEHPGLLSTRISGDGEYTTITVTAQ